jgi:hypothetical protein
MSKPAMILCVLCLVLTALAAFGTGQWWWLGLNTASLFFATDNDADEDDTEDDLEG